MQLPKGKPFKRPQKNPMRTPKLEGAKVKLKVWSIPEVQNKTNACYDVGQHLTKGWTGTIEDILALSAYPVKDLLWICTHPLICPHQIAHPFHMWSAQRAAQIFSDDTFKKPANIPVNLADLVSKGQYKQEWVDAIWDTTDRSEQLSELKTLITQAKEQNA